MLKLNKEEIGKVERWFKFKYGNGLDGFEIQRIDEMVPIYLERNDTIIYEVSYRKNGVLIFTEDDLFQIIGRI